MESDRKTRIADAAIAILGTQGARALTHRAVDAQAGLPAGSTSFYCRTRLDLLKLTLTRHVALDLADLAADAAWDAPARWSLHDLLERVQHRLSDWLREPKRLRLVARFELFLMASREPELAAILAPLRDQFLGATGLALARCGLSDPAERARMLVTVVDGHLLDCIRSGSQAPLSAAQRAMLMRLLQEAR
ncbi:MAG: TetR/AcrR family transcriptional regulator [Aquabacterium sp.]|jgi:AcrR family transcriptional regulator